MYNYLVCVVSGEKTIQLTTKRADRKIAIHYKYLTKELAFFVSRRSGGQDFYIHYLYTYIVFK